VRGVAKKIRGTIEKADGSTGEFVATISEPTQSADHHDYYCVVGCPSLFEGTKRICGVDAVQALALSELFLRDFLARGNIKLSESDNHEPEPQNANDD